MPPRQPHRPSQPSRRFDRHLMAAALLVSLAACEGQPAKDATPSAQASATLSVSDAKVRLGASPDRPSAGYFTIRGGSEATALTAVTTADAQRVELHESMKQDGMMAMGPIANVPVPASGEVAFRPGGKHVMLFGIGEDARRAGKVRLTLAFANGQSLSVDAPLETQGGAAAAADHSGH